MINFSRRLPFCPVLWRSETILKPIIFIVQSIRILLIGA